ncbi:MAG TPA: hypothetical protein VFH17_00325, partial [Coriobacteriia bacterium]|nr:hypothetical protein [Coriobacteriia bacterium]
LGREGQLIRMEEWADIVSLHKRGQSAHDAFRGDAVAVAVSLRECLHVNLAEERLEHLSERPDVSPRHSTLSAKYLLEVVENPPLQD